MEKRRFGYMEKISISYPETARTEAQEVAERIIQAVEGVRAVRKRDGRVKSGYGHIYLTLEPRK